MIYPTVHLNGTSPEMLRDGYLSAREACQEAEKRLFALEFNARDYYPQGADKWAQARDEYAARLAKIHSVSEELYEIAARCQDAIDAREAQRR